MRILIKIKLFSFSFCNHSHKAVPISLLHLTAFYQVTPNNIVTFITANICLPAFRLSVMQNNIAEVEELQTDLLEEGLLEYILTLLQDPQVEVGVRYFAGGILAQLTSRPEAWTLDEELHTNILKQLVCVLDTGFHLMDNKIHLLPFNVSLFLCSIRP